MPFLEPQASLLGEIEVRVHWVFCKKFNSEQFSFKAFCDIIVTFCRIHPKSEPTLPFKCIIIYRPDFINMIRYLQLANVELILNHWYTNCWLNWISPMSFLFQLANQQLKKIMSGNSASLYFYCLYLSSFFDYLPACPLSISSCENVNIGWVLENIF